MTLVNLLLIALNTCHTARLKKIHSKGISLGAHRKYPGAGARDPPHWGKRRKKSQQAN